MKRILIIIMLLPFCLKAQVTLDWSVIYGEVGIATDAGNNVYTASTDFNPAGDIYLTKRNSAGVQQWQVRYNQTNNSAWENATWVETDFAGNIIVTGNVMSGFSNPVNAASIVMKFSPAGTLLWRNVYETSFDGSYTKKCLVDKANNIYVLGLGTGPNGFVTKVKKFDTNGNAVWSYFDNLGIGAALNFKFTPDSNIVIAAKSITGSIMGYAKINRNGINIWNYTGQNSISAGDLAGDAYGNTYIVQGNYGGTGSTIKKLAANGLLKWSANYTNLTAFRIEVGTDNRPVVCGYPIPGSGGSAFLKVDTGSAVVWYNNNADSIYNFLLHAMMKMDQYNNVYLAAGILTNMGMCKVNSDGSNAWTITFGTGSSHSFTIGNDYNVYVTGGATARLHQIAPVQSCMIPVGLTVTNSTASSAKLNWNAVPNALQYQINYKKTTETTWKTKKVSGTKTYTTLSGLTCNTAYKWKIKTICDTVGPDVMSSFSAVQLFNSAPCPLAKDVNISSIMQEEHCKNIYPNPTNGKLMLDFNYSDPEWVQCMIFDLSGKLVFSYRIFVDDENLLHPLDIRLLENGFYLLQISGKGFQETKRIFKQAE